MEQHTNTEATSQPTKLTELAAELGISVDEVAREIGAGNVFRFGGFRCTTGFRASELIAAHDRRRAEAERQAVEASEAAARQHEADRAAAQARRADQSSRVEKFELRSITISPTGPEGLSAVQAMTAGAAADYEGGVATPRPSRLDWMTGAGEGGGTFGPSIKQIREDAKRRKAERGKKP
jgi:hypothetical protein